MSSGLNHTSTSSSYTLPNSSVIAYAGCGVPPFCLSSVKTVCINITLQNCSECSFSGAVVFGILVAVLGFLMIAANFYVLWYSLTKKDSGSFDKIRASLAVADILTGFQLSVVVVYNLCRSLAATAGEVRQYQTQYSNAPGTIIGGISFIFCFTSSLCHLLYMGLQRVYAINWPLRYRVQKMRTVSIGLVCVWIISFLSAVAPAWFPSTLKFIFSQTTMLFTIARADSRSESFNAIVIMIVIIFVLPFLLMTSLTLTSIVILRRKSSRSQNLRNHSTGNAAMIHNKRETYVFITVALMQLGFTITLTPVAIVYLLEVTQVLKCSNISMGFAICFYLTMSNSLVNVFIYIIRDQAFRKSLFKAFSSKRRKQVQPSNSSRSTKHRTSSTTAVTVT